MSQVIPSKVFYCCLWKYQTTFDLDSETRELEEGIKERKRGVFSEELIQRHSGPWDCPGCKV